MTYSRAVRTTIGPGCLTAVFGMGTGVAIQVWSPGKFRLNGQQVAVGVAVTLAIDSAWARGRERDQCGEAVGC